MYKGVENGLFVQRERTVYELLTLTEFPPRSLLPYYRSTDSKFPAPFAVSAARSAHSAFPPPA